MTNADPATSLRLLIADDSRTDRLILQTMLRRQGHTVLATNDGQQALEAYQQWQPDMVLLDVMMPRLDGMETARCIKALAGETLMPIIFLTSLSDSGALAQCLDAGGDDFLPKPYNFTIIEAKIRALDRMRRMHETLMQQRDHIRERNESLIREQETARRVFDNIAHTGCLDAANIRYHASPMSVFNGDILFACPRPAGGKHILLGDFTGHGLPAAIGALPVAEIFYGMTSKGFSGADILRELNQKLVRIMPTGMFCCAAFVEVDFRHKHFRIWNGGLPDGYLLRTDGSREALASTHLPLGILSPERFAASMTEYQTGTGDQLLLLTDGVLEASNEEGDWFREERLDQVLDRFQPGCSPVDLVLDGLRSFAGEGLNRDDVTIFSLCMTEQDLVADRSHSLRTHQSVLSGPGYWSSSYQLEDATLGQFNPLPLLLHVCMGVSGLRQHSGEIYTILSELYTNALEHGVLGLPSSWKHSPEGFARYYAEREKRLAQVTGQFIRFDLKHRMRDGGGSLSICCKDSGDGFDSAGFGSMEPGCPSLRPVYAGRGIMLIRQLSRSLTYNERGNQAEVVYHWDLTDP